jgi:Spy/CpxP family protein refolding chaperone
MEEHRLEMMTKQLSLTSDQVTSIKAIFRASHDQMMALREDTSTPREEKRPKMEAIHKDEQAKIKALLNEDQKTRYEAMEARMRENREEHREHGDAPPPPPQL